MDITYPDMRWAKASILAVCAVLVVLCVRAEAAWSYGGANDREHLQGQTTLIVGVLICAAVAGVIQWLEHGLADPPRRKRGFDVLFRKDEDEQ